MFESFKIFDKYGDSSIHQASHNQIWAGPPVEEVSREDMDFLINAGWVPDNDCFTRSI